MVMNKSKKKDYWNDIGNEEGFLAAVSQLGSDYKMLDAKGEGCQNADGIWGRLAELTKLDSKSTYDARKWLYTVWNNDRRKVRTTFLRTQATDASSGDPHKSPDDITNKSSQNTDEAPKIPSLMAMPSLDPKNLRSKSKTNSRCVYYFTMAYDQWKMFYDYKIEDVHTGWSDRIVSHLYKLGITCTVIFRYHHSRLIDSRKQNCTLFSASGYCKVETCPVKVDIDIASEPKQKGDPSVFKVVVVGEKNHDPKKQKVSRSVTGPLREAIAKEVKTIGALSVYERNLRHANEDLLREGNFSEVPSKEVLDKIKQEYDKKYRLDENCFKEVRMFAFVTRYSDVHSKEVKGFIQAVSEWPFIVKFFTEIQIDRFIKYCRSEKYSCLHVDATGSVVRNLKDQKDVFFYCLVYRHDDSPILPLSGALLTDHTAASITSFLLSVRSKLMLRSKTARPAFVIIDFSAALINSVLASFNVENIHTYLRRCYNTINRMYKTKQLRNMTFLRLCCSHAMKAFSRGLFKINVSKETHHHLMTFFAILLNSTNFDGILDLYRCLIHIYGDPYCDTPYTTLASLLNKPELAGFDIEHFLEESDVQDDKELKQDFLEETNFTTDAIIRQSPFNIKARANIPALNRFFERKKLDESPRNQLFSAKIIYLLHKWFAYIPLWSGMLVGFYERYAKDKTPATTNQWEFGCGRVSNASIETYFRTIKSSVLEHHTTLRPNDFLMRIHNHVLARMKGDQFDVAQTSHGRKKKKNEADDLNILDKWKRRHKKNPKAGKQTSHFNDNVSKTVASKIAKGRNEAIVSDRNLSPSNQVCFSSKKTTNFDDPDSDKSVSSSNDCSVGFSVLSSQMPRIIDVNTCSPKANSPSPSPIKIDAPAITYPSSSDNIFLALSDITESHLSRATNSKRLHSSSNSDGSITAEQTSKQPCLRINKHISPHTTQSNLLHNTKDNRTTTIGTLELTWPSYGIENGTYADECYFIFHTCTIDTGLFILYHAYKAHSNDFRNLFTSDELGIFKIIRRTFHLVETEGWTVARLYWLTEHNLLTNKHRSGKYDLMNTMEAIVFQFIKPMQTFPVTSKCSCTVCPKRIREHISMDISLVTREHPCRADLGHIKPRKYPAKYSVDDKFPVVDLETNVTRTEKRYICEANRIIDIAKLVHKSPFLIVDVGFDLASMRDSPDPLYIGEYTYNLSAAINNTNQHFTAVIKMKDGTYYHFDDTHPKGCVSHDGRILVELALYVLELY
ncbi:unnamed protein product [Adineta ricciae]|uniref:Uncharacterized protein n=1 Tax=Adineta ricciae TaxID=249248 RepID=A0A815ENR0_ADIRI|nr:unnamed protein product [Adineta ricciae]